MSDSPETRLSLLLRLQNGEDETAWEEFHEIYRPVLTRMVAACGLAAQDQADAVQDIWLAIYRGIEKYEPRPHAFAFRGWLARVSRNTALNILTRRKSSRHAMIGGDAGSLPDNSTSYQFLQEKWELEYQRQILEWAAKRVADTVTPTTFTAFWRTTVEGENVTLVAEELGLSVGAIYVSRGRIMAKLKREVESRRCTEE